MRFAVLIHDHPFLHWDLLLESGEKCRTWRLLDSPEEPSPLRVEQIADHRLHYLTYTGPVEGDRGIVSRWDRGTLVWLVDQPDEVRVFVQGEKWRGRLLIQQQQLVYSPE